MAIPGYWVWSLWTIECAATDGNYTYSGGLTLRALFHHWRAKLRRACRLSRTEVHDERLLLRQRHRTLSRSGGNGAAGAIHRIPEARSSRHFGHFLTNDA